MLKYKLLVVLFVWSTAVFSQSDTSSVSLEWHTDAMKVLVLSKATGKPVFAFFTGSDWCGWCKLMQKNVFSKPEFVEWADKNFVMLELDFPNKKPQSQELMQQNHGLKQFFGIKGYPTVWMFFMAKDVATGKINITPIGSLGYPPRSEPGKEHLTFMNEANKLLASHFKK